MNVSPPIPSRLLKLYAACATWSLRLLAVFWLLIALAWGALHGWIVPRIGEWRPTLEQQASRVLGVPVRIGSVSARSTGLIPSIELDAVVLLDPQGREALRLPQVVASLSPRSLWNLGFDQLFIDRPELDVRRAADGRILVAGLDLSSGTGGHGGADWFFAQRELVVRGGTLRWTDETRGLPELTLADVDFVVRNGARSHALRLDATPPASWGERFTLQGVFRQPLLSTHAGRWREWDGQVHASFRRIDLAQLRRLATRGVQVDSGHGALQAWVDVSRGQATGALADLSVADVSTRLAPDLQPLALASLSGRLRGKRWDGGFEFETRQLQFVTAEGQRWPGGNVFVSWSDASGKRPAAGELRGDRLDLAALGQLAGRLPLGAATHEALSTYAPQGLVESVTARWQGPPQAPDKLQAKGRISGLHVAAVPARPAPGGARPGIGTPGIRNAAIDFDLTEGGGKARLAVESGALELPGVFDDPLLPFDRLAADLQWQANDGRIAVTANGLRFSNADAQGEGHASWRTGDDPARRYPGMLDLQATLTRANGARVWRYLPLAVPQNARDYVREAVQQADVTDGRFRVKGDLHDFPFARSRGGEFRVTAQVRNASYAFVPKGVAKAGAAPWPALTQLAGRLVFDRGGMRVEDAQGRFSTGPNLRFKADADIADLSHTRVLVDGEVRGPLAEALTVVQRSPLNALTQDALARAAGTGPADVRLKLALPIEQVDRSQVQGTVTLAGNDVQVTPDSPVLARARGAVTFNERGFTLVGTQARTLGGDVRLEGGTRPGAIAGETAVVVRAQGTASADGLRQARELGMLARLARQATGQAAYNATLTFRKATPEILVTSNLQGLGLNLPPPLAKAPDAVLPLRYENALLRDAASLSGQTDQLSVDLGRIASVSYVRDISGPEPRVLRGAIGIGLGAGESAALPDAGVAANIALGTANVDAWEQVIEGLGSGAPPPAPAPGARTAAAGGAAQGYLPTVMAVRAKELTVEGRTLHNLVVGGLREGLLWRGNVDADELSGYVEYRQPAGAGAGRVYARLARLSIAAAAANAVEALLDEQPASMPALDVVVDEFELRGRKLGRLEIDAVNRGGGAVVREGGVREWRLNKLSLATPEATFSATGNWAALDAQAAPPGGPRPPRPGPAERRRTVMNFRLDLADAGELLHRFGMKDVVRRGAGRMEGQVAWIGSPLGLDYPSMTGSFHVDVVNGQFLKADPGLAKLLGVLSLQSLPRRLALDFRDVFSQGFAFDFVRGDITIQQGIAATNNLQMKGVNAAVLMEGKADIGRETQDLRVVVVPEINAGTASLVAAAINPAIGLGTFLAQIFLRQPLARATTQQFQVDGTWADPRVTRIGRDGKPVAENKPAEPAQATGSN